MIEVITTNDLSKISSNAAVVFSADWCESCHDLLNRLEPISDTLNTKIYNVDVDTNEELAVQYYIKTLPCTILFKDGKQKDRFDNNFRFQDLLDKIRSI